jgi:hypothetical protein
MAKKLADSLKVLQFAIRVYIMLVVVVAYKNFKGMCRYVRRSLADIWGS